MATNSFFKPYAYKSESAVLQSLVVESIKAVGFDVKYIPRTVVERDDLFGEAVHSRFEKAATVEMYVKDINGFEGEGDIMSRFGLQIRDSVTFTLARRRWEQIRTEKMLTEVGYCLLLESSPDAAVSESDCIVLEGVGDGYQIESIRPNEGDLIWWDVPNMLFEIKFVEHEQQFYQFGDVHTYDLKCEKFRYSSESIATGHPTIDAVEVDFSMNILNNQLTDDTGVSIVNESGMPLINEPLTVAVGEVANNEMFFVKGAAFIDMTDVNPFLEN